MEQLSSKVQFFAPNIPKVTFQNGYCLNTIPIEIMKSNIINNLDKLDEV